MPNTEFVVIPASSASRYVECLLKPARTSSQKVFTTHGRGRAQGATLPRSMDARATGVRSVHAGLRGPPPTRLTPAPDVVIVMGVSGRGKIDRRQGHRDRLGWEFAEGDDFHSEANVAKMRAGHPLDRRGPLAVARAIGDWIGGRGGRASPPSSPARRCGASTGTCCARAARLCASATSRRRRRRDRGPDGAPHRSLHAGLAAAQPAGHARAPRSRRARRRASPSRAPPRRSSPTRSRARASRRTAACISAP